MPSTSRRLLLVAAALALALSGCTADAPAPDGSSADGSADVSAPDEEPEDDGSAEDRFHPSLDHLERGTVTLVRAEDDGRFEVAVTVPSEREEFTRGLMEVPELADGTGMLFDFGEQRTGGFWMKDTLVPLDIAFASGGGEVLAVLAMDPCEEEPCPTYDPGVAYRYALEVPQGWFDANDLGPGDRLEVADGA